MTDVIVAAMVISLLLQAALRSYERLYASSIFVGLSVVHLILSDTFSELGGIWPYLIASSFDVVMMMLMAQISIVVPTTISLYRICLAEIVLNFAGWRMWDMEIQHYDKLYLSAFSLLSVYTIYILLRKDAAHDKRRFRIDTWRDLIRAVAYPRNSHIQRGSE